VSWDLQWRFEKLPTEIELRRHVEAVRETAGLAVARFAVRDDGIVEIQFDVPVAGAEGIPAKLGVSNDAPEAILRDPQHLVVVAQQRDVTKDAPGRDDLYDMGCVAKVLKFVRMDEDGSGTLIALGAARTRLGTLTQAADSDLVTVVCFPAAEAAPPAGDLTSAVQALRADVRRLMRVIAGISQPPDLGRILDAVTDPGPYVDAVIGTTIHELQLDDCGQELLETLDTAERIRSLHAVVRGRFNDWMAYLPD
jgi:ATP-dependent Lon protease